eukprot:scaffold5258_cov26-Cyclotella_meneghiniana.AAC.4
MTDDMHASSSFWQHVFDDSRDQAVSPSRDGIIAFKEHIIHFNNAGASPSPKPVLWAVANHLSKEAVFVNRTEADCSE